MKDVTIAIPHAYTTKWLQIVLTSLKAFKNKHEFDILILNNTPENDSIRGITETGLSEGVRIEVPPVGSRVHARALDYAIDIIDTPYLFATETDCRALKNNWLDGYFDYMKDEYVAMVGWFWDLPGTDRLYINSSATLYSMNILKRLRKETLANDNLMICYGTGLKKRYIMSEYLQGLFKNGNWGPFSEQRGYQEIFHFRDDKNWQEPGCWLYFRAQCEYECVRIPGVWETNENPHVASATWYGSKDDPYYVHYWGGTSSHNWEKHEVRVGWELLALPWWIDREDRIWKEVVDEKVRKKTLEMGLVKTGEEEKQFILNHPNVKPYLDKL
jgi:hypothetical protein